MTRYRSVENRARSVGLDRNRREISLLGYRCSRWYFKRWRVNDPTLNRGGGLGTAAKMMERNAWQGWKFPGKGDNVSGWASIARSITRYSRISVTHRWQKSRACNGRNAGGDDAAASMQRRCDGDNAARPCRELLRSLRPRHRISRVYTEHIESI